MDYLRPPSHSATQHPLGVSIDRRPTIIFDARSAGGPKHLKVGTYGFAREVVELLVGLGVDRRNDLLGRCRALLKNPADGSSAFGPMSEIPIDYLVASIQWTEVARVDSLQIELLKTPQALKIGAHVPIGRSDHRCAFTQDDIAGEETRSALEQEAEVIG